MSRWLVIVFPFVIACAPAVLSPADPVRSAQIAALGSEAAGTPPGPLHRPGQPCVLCHDGQGGPRQMSVAGTIFRDDMDRTPLADADVVMIDSAKTRFTAHTNCVGNFFVWPGDYQPVFPFWVAVSQGANASPMETPIQRDGSCASCHFDPLGARTAGHIYLTADELVVPTIPTRACRPDEGKL
ncbi:MAG TPA: hypothetical protein VGL59_00910 [Polyangia bacterium]